MANTFVLAFVKCFLPVNADRAGGTAVVAAVVVVVAAAAVAPSAAVLAQLHQQKQLMSYNQPRKKNSRRIARNTPKDRQNAVEMRDQKEEEEEATKPKKPAAAAARTANFLKKTSFYPKLNKKKAETAERTSKEIPKEKSEEEMRLET